MAFFHFLLHDFKGVVSAVGYLVPYVRWQDDASSRGIVPRIVPVNEEAVAPERVVANGSEGHHMGAVSMSVVRQTDGIDPSGNWPYIVSGLRRRIVPAGSGSGIAGGHGSSVSGEPSSALAIRPMHAKHYMSSSVGMPD
jgi:hypothetical protein